jgi:phage-related protein
MSTWRVETFEDNRGQDVISEFLKDLNRGAGKKAVAKIERTIDMLAEEGMQLPDDVLRKVRGDLWELRATFQRNPYRVLLYHAGGGTFVLLHAMHKKDQTIPESDILKAEHRMAEDQARRGG